MLLLLLQKEVYVQVIRSTVRHICEGGNTVPHENIHIRKTNLIKTLEITAIYRRELLNYTKEL